VHLYGTDDGRTSTLDGPYFAASKDRPAGLRALSHYEVGWVRTVTFADGMQKVQPIISTYAKPLWRSLVKKYDGVDGMKLVTQK